MRNDVTLLLVLLTCVTAAIPALLRFWSRRRWQFSVRHLLVLSSLVAVATFLFARESERLAEIRSTVLAVVIIYLGFVLAIATAITFSGGEFLQSRTEREQEPAGDGDTQEQSCDR